MLRVRTAADGYRADHRANAHPEARRPAQTPRQGRARDHAPRRRPRRQLGRKQTRPKNGASKTAPECPPPAARARPPAAVARPPRRAEGIKHARGARTQHGPRNGPNSSSETQPKRLLKVPGGCFGVRVLRRLGTHKIARCGARTFLRQPSQARGAGSSTTASPENFLW